MDVIATARGIDEVLWIVHSGERKKEPGQVFACSLILGMDEHTTQASSSTIPLILRMAPFSYLGSGQVDLEEVLNS